MCAKLVFCTSCHRIVRITVFESRYSAPQPVACGIGLEMIPALRVKVVTLSSALACIIAFVTSPTVRHTASIITRIAWLYVVTGARG